MSSCKPCSSATLESNGRFISKPPWPNCSYPAAFGRRNQHLLMPVTKSVARTFFLAGLQLDSEKSVQTFRTKHFQDEIFLDQLPNMVNEIRGSYDDDRSEEGDTRKSSLQITQTLLHTPVTETVIKRALGHDTTVGRTDFASFRPTLPHLTITSVLKALGISKTWVDFFRRTLEAPVNFMEDGPNATVKIRKRGTPPTVLVN
ncbi:hypothetical protein WAI453_005396 [Rhynchosporium graminicola]